MRCAEGTSDDAGVMHGDVAAAHTLAGRDCNLVLGTRAAAESTEVATKESPLSDR